MIGKHVGRVLNRGEIVKKNFLKITFSFLLLLVAAFINNDDVYAAKNYSCTYGNVVKINVIYKENSDEIEKIAYAVIPQNNCGTRDNYCYRPTFNDDKTSSGFDGTLNVKKWSPYFKNSECPILYAKVTSNCEQSTSDNGCFHDYVINHTKSSDYKETLNPYNSNTVNNCQSNLVNEFNKVYNSRRSSFINIYNTYFKEIESFVGISKAEYDEYKTKVQKDCAKVEQDYKNVYLISYNGYGLNKCNFEKPYETLKTQIDNEIKAYNDNLAMYLKELVYEGLGTNQMTEEEANEIITGIVEDTKSPFISDWGDQVEVNCEGILGQELLDFLNKIFRWIQILAPIFVILISGIDFAGAVLQDDKDAMKKASNKFIKRLIIAVALFFIPLILSWLLNIFNDITGAASSTCGIGE